MRRPLRVATIVLTSAALLACGGGGADGRAYAEAVAANLATQLGVDEETSTCLGDAMVDVVGTAPFEDADLEPEDVLAERSLASQLGRGTVGEEDAAEVVAAWRDCTDLPHAYAQRISADYELDAAEMACLGTALRVERDVFDDYLRRSLVTDRVEELNDPLTGIVLLVQACTERDGQGGFLVESIATSLADQGQVSLEQGRCIARQLVDRLGAEELISRTGVGELETAPVETQDEFAQAILDATAACGVPVTPQGG